MQSIRAAVLFLLAQQPEHFVGAQEEARRHAIEDEALEMAAARPPAPEAASDHD
jgi:hypothetical protein